MTPDLEDRFAGSLLGLALGDALGAPHEGGPVVGFVWSALMGGLRGRLRWTDDTQMVLATAESIVENGRLDVDELAVRWAREMEWKRGYGPGARKLLSRVAKGQPWREASRSVFPDGSFGNGAAMRAAPLGLFFHAELDRLVEATELASSVTHAHPLGVEGGVLIARATALALDGIDDPGGFLATLREGCQSDEYRARLDVACELLGREPNHRAIVRQLGHGIRAVESAPTAVYLASRFHDAPFETLIEHVISLGGDVDTIGAMAGGIWGAARGAGDLPRATLARLEASQRIERAARSLHTVATT